MSILELAHRWAFSEVKDLAVRQLEKINMPDVQRIVIYQKYEVDKALLVPRYAALCAREEPLGIREGLELGLETALMLARGRECARSPPRSDGARSPSPANIKEDDMHGIIKTLFGVPAPSAAPSPNGQGPASSPGAGSSAGGWVTCSYNCSVLIKLIDPV